MRGVPEIVPVTAGETWRVIRRGLAFEADRLLALAADDAGAVIVTGIGTHTAEGLAGLAPLSKPVAPDPGARSLDAMPVTPGASVVWARTDAGPLVWDRSSQAWRAPMPDERPWDLRLAVSRDRLRVWFRAGRAAAEVQVMDLSGAETFVPFSWQRGEQMPFDRVNAVAVEGNTILLGTDFGLRRLRATAYGAVSEALYSGVPEAGRPRRFDRVGRPDTAPGRLLAEANGACFELASPKAPPRRCETVSDTLSRRFVLSSDLWHWRKSDTAIEGEYLYANGTPLKPVSWSSGRRWPHDRLRRIARCNGQTVELWADEYVVAQNGSGVLRGLALLPGASDIFCQDVTAVLDAGRRLGSGLYASGANAVWILEGGGWRAVDETDAVVRRAKGDVPWERGRLRITRDRGRLVTEHLWQDGAWRPLTLVGGKTALDVVLGLGISDGQLHLVTQAGAFPWAGGIDPDSLILRTPPERDGLENCRPLSIEARDGSVHAVPAQPGGPVAIFCDDGRAFVGKLTDSRDVGAFSALDEPPNATRVLAETPGWTWLRRAAGATDTALDIVFKGEDIALAGGRLSIDDYSGIAAPFAGHVELVTQSAGWWRFPSGNLSSSLASRPPMEARSTEATALHTDFTEKGISLCIEAGQRIAMAADGELSRAPFCRDWRGADRMWRWYGGAGSVAAEGVALNGVPMQRRLRYGRFDDLFVVAAPMIDRTEGEEAILAPTRAGVLVLRQDGPAGIYSAAAPGFVADSVSGVPVLLTHEGSVRLADDGVPACSALAELLPLLEETDAVHRVVSTAFGAVRVTVRRGTELEQLLVTCDTIEGTLSQALPLRVSHRQRYRALGGQTLAPGLLVWTGDHTLTVADSDLRGVVLPWTGQRTALSTAAPDARAILLATDRTLFRLDIDRALAEIARSGRKVSTPPGPFVPSPPAPQPAPGTSAAATAAPQSETEDGHGEGGSGRSGGRASQEPQPAVLVETDFGNEPSFSPQPQFDNTTAVQLSREQIRDVQRILRDGGFLDGPVDGIIGPLTRAAIRAWQDANGFTVTSELTELQFHRLMETQ